MVPIEILRSLPYFAGVSPDSLKHVATISEEHDFAAGETLFHEGDDARGIYILRSGEIDIIYGLHHDEQRVVDTVVTGDLIGWSTLVEPYRRTATATARQGGAAVFIAAQQLRSLCDTNHTLGYHLMSQLAQTLSRRLQGALVQLAAT